MKIQRKLWAIFANENQKNEVVGPNSMTRVLSLAISFQSLAVAHLNEYALNMPPYTNTYTYLVIFSAVIAACAALYEP